MTADNICYNTARFLYLPRSAHHSNDRPILPLVQQARTQIQQEFS